MLALFPLNIIVFPNEDLNLHIFEPRYRQLVNDLLDNNTSFGIPTFIDDAVQAFGTEVELVEVVNRYSDGRFDIRTKGKRIFKLDTFFNPMPDKLYAGGEVEYMENEDEADIIKRIQLVEAVSEMYAILKITTHLDKDTHYLSYKLGHKIGLSQKQEYELLTIFNETDRIEYMLEHLEKAIPIVRETERMKEIIRMNGHFKRFGKLEF